MNVAFTNSPYIHTTPGAVKPPKHYCKTCGHKDESNVCDCFERHVEPDYNRCFYHTHYVPIPAEFVKPIQDQKVSQIA
ncbi:MAG: hypothetical protein NC334_09520 [Bacteroides sp.]|nr:hypothetical protein [Bacteroides sp.]